MRQTNLFLAAAAGAAILGAAAVVPAASWAQSATQHIATSAEGVASGQRSSKLVGSKVVNEQNQTIGSVDDLIISPKDNVPFAIISVGGFLGIGDRLVAVPFKELQINEQRIMLPGGSKEALKSMPAFRYNT